MKIYSISHEPDEIKRTLEERLSLLPEGTIVLNGQAIMTFTRWMINGKERTVLKITPAPGSSIETNLPIEAMYININPVSVSFEYKKEGFLIFYKR